MRIRDLETTLRMIEKLERKIFHRLCGDCCNCVFQTCFSADAYKVMNDLEKAIEERKTASKQRMKGR